MDKHIPAELEKYIDELNNQDNINKQYERRSVT